MLDISRILYYQDKCTKVSIHSYTEPVVLCRRKEKKFQCCTDKLDLHMYHTNIDGSHAEHECLPIIWLENGCLLIIRPTTDAVNLELVGGGALPCHVKVWSTGLTEVKDFRLGLTDSLTPVPVDVGVLGDANVRMCDRHILCT